MRTLSRSKRVPFHWHCWLAERWQVFSVHRPYEEERICCKLSFCNHRLVAGASQGEGLGNKFLANIRETDAICEVVRFFSDPNVEHVSKKVDPQSDVETIKTELILADIATIEKALPRLEKEAL